MDLLIVGASAREITFTIGDGSGNPLPAIAAEPPGGFANLCGYLTRVAADPATPPGEQPFGHPDQARVLIGYDGYEAPHYRIHCTVAYPVAGGEPQVVVSRALASAASLARLVDGLNGIDAAGQGIFKWTVAD